MRKDYLNALELQPGADNVGRFGTRPGAPNGRRVEDLTSPLTHFRPDLEHLERVVPRIV
jgi:hypothetical protein